MVNVHVCRDCGHKVYYKPVFDSVHQKGMNSFGLEGYTMGFQAMNLDKTKHVCKLTAGMAIGEEEFIRKSEQAIYEAETNYGDGDVRYGPPGAWW